MSARPFTQRGLALVCALLMMAAAMVIGVAVARGAFALLASARNEGDRVTARLVAEAALQDAERDIAGTGAGASAARSALFAAADGAGFVAGCGRGPADLGLCRVTAPPAWHSVDLGAADADVLVPYGQFTGAALPLGAGTLPARLPGYLIERLAPAGVDPTHGSFYRITAIGFGMRASTRVVLQSLYRVPPPAAPPAAGDADAGDAADAGADAPTEEPTGESADEPAAGPTNEAAGPDPPSPPAAVPPAALPAGRIGWREIANWPELHARAQP